jgi:hypothetical protein
VDRRWLCILYVVLSHAEIYFLTWSKNKSISPSPLHPTVIPSNNKPLLVLVLLYKRNKKIKKKGSNTVQYARFCTFLVRPFFFIYIFF